MHKSPASVIPECPQYLLLEASTGPLQIDDLDWNLGLDIFFSTESLSSKLSFKTKSVRLMKADFFLDKKEEFWDS